ncbi:MAG: hypothetical protein ACI8QZ_000276 [Chlamydiales bacterium]|jgi:hypothetical protein
MQLNGRTSLILTFAALLGLGTAFGVPTRERSDPFRQLEEILPTPNAYRTASGAPGHAYWQQRADYEIDVELDDKKQLIIGSERITYFNNSPDTLRYIWVQLDPNIFSPESHAAQTRGTGGLSDSSYGGIESMLARRNFDGSVILGDIRDDQAMLIPHVVNDTMLRIDIADPLKPGESVAFSIEWEYAINNARKVRGRTGYEFFREDGNYLYEIAQWFPRMAAYTDVNGWQHKQFLGAGEFTLEFGNYTVNITVPDDHIVAATGELQNADEVLTSTQVQRLEEARTAKRPMFIVTPEEARTNEDSTPQGKKTWTFEAFDVRDFAFASSRKFIWDAQGHDVQGNSVMAMSFYPNEGEPLWSRYSTHAIIHTLDVYSHYTFAYPYPVAISVNGPIGGMEYPMICFNGPRPEKDGTYSKRTKYGLISVIIHEVGHNYFPMIVNSDERQWTWMDEGLNTFLQFLSEQEWEDDYPARRGDPRHIVSYMTSSKQVPVMTNSESLLQFGSNAYAKPATALNILRETVMGRELFDFAFKEYAQRWMFKRPQPADFFRTMEDASAVDLDWFWRGWFFSTESCDIAIGDVTLYTIAPQDPDSEKARQREERDAIPESLTHARNKELPKRVASFPELLDFYNDYDDLDVTQKDRKKFDKLIEGLEDNELMVMSTDLNFYTIELLNQGGLVMPVVLQVDYEDQSSEEIRIPAEIWRRDSSSVTRLLMTEKTVERIILDPHLETADSNLDNNHYPPKTEQRTILLKKRPKSSNPMRDAQKAEGKGAAEETVDD